MNSKIINNIIGRCFNCNKTIKELDDYYNTENGNFICENCCEDLDYRTCDECGKAFSIDELHYVESEDFLICENCLESSNDYKICNDCGEVFNFSREGIQLANGDYICEDCRDNYFYCENCGEYYHNDEYNEDEDGNALCENCYNEYEQENLLHNYGYKPDIEIQSTGDETEDEKKLYIGFELETEKDDSNLSRADFCKKINDTINKKMNTQFLYFKEDGSLDCGVEIVSHPFTLDFFRQNEDLFRILCTTASSMNYTSHNSKNCGLHVHINRQYFGDNYEEQEKNIEKLILFFEYFKEKIQKFSRRTDFHYCHFLSDNGERKEKICNLKYIKENKGQNRYVAVNVENSNTVEVRIFRGTLNADTFIATLQWVFNLVRIVKNNPIEKITWSKTINLEFSKSIKEYCKTRQIDNSYEFLKDYSIKEAFLQKKFNKKLVNLIEQEYLPKIKEIQNTLIINEGFENIKNEIENNKRCYDINNFFYKYSKAVNVDLEILKIQNILNKAKKGFIEFENLKSYFRNYMDNIRYNYSDVNHHSHPFFKIAHDAIRELNLKFIDEKENI